MQPKEQIIYFEIPGKPWEMVGADMFILPNKNCFCIVDYDRKFPVIKEMENLSADSLILECNIIFSECQLPKKILKDTGSNFMSDKFETFCKDLNIECATSLSYHQHSNGQVEACIKFISQALKKCSNTDSDTHIALLQI